MRGLLLRTGLIRFSLLRALVAATRAAWLRMCIRTAESDCRIYEAQALAVPTLIASRQVDIADMRCRLEALQPQLDALRRSQPLAWTLITCAASLASFTAWVFWQ